MKKNDLKEMALRLQGIIEAAIDGIITIDQQGSVEQINKAAAELFQYTPEEVIGNNVKMLMPQPYKREHDSYISNYLSTKIPRIIGIGREVKGKKKDGSVFPFRLAVSEVVLNDRIIFNGIIHDLTDIKEAQDQLRRTNEILEEKVEERTNKLEEVINELLLTNKKLKASEEELTAALENEKELNLLKSRFVSMASHEFRTPLSTVLSSASLISKYPLESQQQNREKHVKRIKSAVANLTGILNDFLSLDKLEEGKVNVAHSSIDLQPLLNQIVEELKGLLKGNQKIELDIEVENDLNSDARILKNVLFNLLSNAIKYSDKEVFCKVTEINNNIEFEIVDRGLGIPENEQKFLFSRFFRASNVENIQGTGLGLNIVNRYIDLLGGQIRFESELGVGTTFFISIPKNYA